MTKPENDTQPQDDGHEPQVYMVQKDLIGWRFSRRDFLAAASAATMATVAGTASGCGDGEPTPAPSTRTPEESATWEACRRVKAHTEPVAQLVITPDGTLLVSADGDGTIKFWTLPEGRLAACLIDLAANDAGIEGVTYRIGTEFGDTREYTFPCGASIPAGAVCTCNCVAGSICICVGDTGPRGGQHYWHPC